MIPKTAIKHAWETLAYPRAAFAAVRNKSLEDTLADYVRLVITSGLFAGLAALLIALVRAAYLDVFNGVGINYLFLLNYYTGIAIGTFFFYLFAGTFLFFALTLLVRPFAKGLKYTKLVQILCMAMSPMLLFGWVTVQLLLALGIWSAFLIVVGVQEGLHTHKKANRR